MRKLVFPPAKPDLRSGTVGFWLKKPGQSFRKGEPLVQIELEDSLLLLEASSDGVLSQIIANRGVTVPVNADLALLSDADAVQSAHIPPQSNPEPSSAVIPILMPQAGQSMEEGTLVKWRVKEGDSITKGQIIFEVETDKATVEVEAVDSGKIAKIVLSEGGTLPVKQPVAFIADNVSDVNAYLASNPTVTAVVVPASSPHASSTPVIAKPVSNRVAGDRVKASPAARKLAAERNVDLSALPAGSGPDGRILSTDLPSSSLGTRKKMSKMRRAIASNLQISKQNIPHFYMRLTVDAQPLFSLYRREKASYPVSLNDVVTASVAKAVREFSAFRSRLEKDEIVESSSVNIGIAVGVDDGLTVPVLLDADKMSLRQIAENSKRIAENARAGRLEGVGQGSITLSNLGMFGVEEFSAIINPPEAAILAIGAARESISVKDGVISPARVMTLTLSSDHRIIDGMLAAKFLSRLKEILESPEKHLSL